MTQLPPPSAKAARRHRLKLAPGIYQDATGITSRVSVGTVGTESFLVREKRWPLGTLLRPIQTWQDVTRGELRLATVHTRTGWDADCLTHLAQIKATFKNPRSYCERVRDLHEWDLLFRGRLRSSITLKEVNDQLYAWRAADLAASTVNHRLDAISHLFLLEDGAKHELVGAVRFTRPDQVARWIDRGRITRVLDALSPGVTRARMRLLHWTGMRPSQLARLTEESFALDGPSPYVLVPKGKNGLPIATPLTAEGVAAAREFLRAEAWCKVQADGSTKDWTTSANRLLLNAATKLGVGAFTTYQIRHSFLRALRASGTDLADVQKFGGHKDPRTTEIYAPVVDLKLVAAVQRLSTPPAPEAKTKTSRRRRAS